MDLQKVKHASHLRRDPVTGALLNVDKQSLMAYKKQKQHNAKIHEIEQRFSSLDDKLNKIMEKLGV